MTEQREHEIILRNRQQMILTGVLAVDNFDSSMITLSTTAGILVLQGADLHIDHLLLKEQQIEVTGTMDGLYYDLAKAKKSAKGKHLLGRLLK